jgi:hypothetical protein
VLVNYVPDRFRENHGSHYLLVEPRDPYSIIDYSPIIVKKLLIASTISTNFQEYLLGGADSRSLPSSG